MYKHILIATDGSALAAKAVEAGLSLAAAGGAKVTALHVVSHFHLHYQPWAAPRSVHTKIESQHEEEAREAAQKMVDALVTRAKEKGVSCDGLVVVGDHPYEEIIKSAEARKCDLIMMASHGRRGLDAVLLGSETAKVLTHSRVPVLVVR